MLMFQCVFESQNLHWVTVWQSLWWQW